jgi:putative membrane protein
MTDLEERVGLARQTKLTLPAATPPQTLVELRADDPELGRAISVPKTVESLTETDLRNLREADEAKARQELAEAEELLASDPGILRWAGIFAQPLVAAFLLGTVGVLGLYLTSQVMSILANIATQPIWAQYLSYFGLGLLSTCVLFAMMQFLRLYLSLRRNRQLRLSGLAELQSRTRLRWLVNAKVSEARTLLSQYLTDYPLESKKLTPLGVTPELLKSLDATRRDLLDANRFASSNIWFDEFRQRFQTPLDELAEARVKYWSNRAMVVTALSPNSLVDSASTMYFGFALLTDLTRLYNLRTGRTGTAVLLGRVFFNSYLAGQLNDVESVIEGQADHVFEQGLHMVGVGVGSGAASKILGKVGAKATTGYLNRILLIRLGRYACRLLRPVM